MITFKFKLGNLGLKSKRGHCVACSHLEAEIEVCGLIQGGEILTKEAAIEIANEAIEALRDRPAEWTASAPGKWRTSPVVKIRISAQPGAVTWHQVVK